MGHTAVQIPVAVVDVIRIVWEIDPVDPAQLGEGNDPDSDYYSCRAVAEVSYPCGSAGERRIEYLSSGGLYGIEAPDDDYKRVIEDEEIAALEDHLRVFRVEIPAVRVIENRTRA